MNIGKMGDLFEEEPIDKFDMTRCIADLKSISSNAEIPKYLSYLSGHSGLRGISIQLGQLGRSEIGPSCFSIFFTESEDGTIEVILIDEQQGNYAGGPIWQKGDEAERLQRILKKIYQRAKMPNSH